MSIKEWSWMDDKKTETKTNKVHKCLQCGKLSEYESYCSSRCWMDSQKK